MGKTEARFLCFDEGFLRTCVFGRTHWGPCNLPTKTQIVLQKSFETRKPRFGGGYTFAQRRRKGPQKRRKKEVFREKALVGKVHD